MNVLAEELLSRPEQHLPPGMPPAVTEPALKDGFGGGPALTGKKGTLRSFDSFDSLAS